MSFIAPGVHISLLNGICDYRSLVSQALDKQLVSSEQLIHIKYEDWRRELVSQKVQWEDFIVIYRQMVEMGDVDGRCITNKIAENTERRKKWFRSEEHE